MQGAYMNKTKKETIGKGLWLGYKPNRLSFYLMLLNAGRVEQCYNTIHKDMEKYKIKGE